MSMYRSAVSLVEFCVSEDVPDVLSKSDIQDVLFHYLTPRAIADYGLETKTGTDRVALLKCYWLALKRGEVTLDQLHEAYCDDQLNELILLNPVVIEQGEWCQQVNATGGIK